MRFFNIIAMGMAAFMDFGVGVGITSLVAFVAGNTLEPWQLIIGGMLAFLPDVDIALLVLTGRRDKVPLHHTMLMHRPLLVIPVATAIAGYFFGAFWGVVTFLCVVYHYLHDTKGPLGGAGLQWFWPFSKMEWSFNGPEPPSQHLNPELDNWLENNWLRPSNVSLREIGLGTTALAIGVGLSYSVCTAFMFASLFPLGAFWVWWMHVEAKVL